MALEYINLIAWGAPEKLRPFVATDEILKGVVEDLILDETDYDLRQRLLELSNLKPDSDSHFRVVKSEMAKDWSDVAVVDGVNSTSIFTLGVGGDSVIYFNMRSIPDRRVYKSKPIPEFKSVDDLKTVLREFILVEPIESEIRDVSKEALNRDMKKTVSGPKVDFEKFKNFKK